MTDETLQSLLRRAREGEPGAVERWLQALAQTGTISVEHLKVAGELGNPLAKAAAGALVARLEGPEPQLFPCSETAWQAMARAAIQAALEATGDSLPPEGRSLADALLACPACPCPEHGQGLFPLAEALQTRVGRDVESEMWPKPGRDPPPLSPAATGTGRAMCWAVSAASADTQRDLYAAITMVEALIAIAAARCGKWPAEPNAQDEASIIRALLPVMVDERVY